VKRAMVVGLGSGSTAGWLGAIPEVERVDVAELEPAMLHVAEVSALANQDAMKNERVHVLLGDAREILLASHDRYDLVASEPSNPYRAGVASLFTREYYEAIANRLTEDGLFLQWLQAYAIDTPTTRTVYATLGSVFPEVETWELGGNDLVLVASRKPIRYDLPRLRDRVQKEPYRSALLHTWRTSGVEGLFSHYVARASFARAMAHAAGPQLNTDDRSVVEFGFARVARDFQGGSVTDVRDVARARGEHRPRLLEKHVDWERAMDEWIAFRASEQNEIRLSPEMNEQQRMRAVALVAFLSGRLSDVANNWKAQPREPRGPTELATFIAAYAEVGDESVAPLIDQLRALEPVEADVLLARLRLRQDRLAEATQAIIAAFTRYRTDPWAWPFLMSQTLETTKELAQRHPPSLPALRAALSEPFACYLMDEARQEVLLLMARNQPMDDDCAKVLEPLEPYFPWTIDLLQWRAQCYQRVAHPEAARAQAEAEEFFRAQPLAIGDGMVGR
jgi:hypothetical protein